MESLSITRNLMNTLEDQEETIMTFPPITNSPTGNNDQNGFEIFIGHLKPDVEQDVIEKELQNLFSIRGVKLKHEDFSILRGRKKIPKHLFVKVKSEQDRQELIRHFNGSQNLDFVVENKALKVQPRNGSLPQNRKRKKKPDSNENELFGYENANLGRSKSEPISVTSALSSGFVGVNLHVGQTLQTEDRITEYKLGRGKYLKKNLVAHVRKYVCAFLNSEGGKLMIGVADNGKVHGVTCTRKQEDTIRILVDSAIGKFQPPVFPAMYTVRFIPVISRDTELNNNVDNDLKVLEIEVHDVSSVKTLYETDKGEVYIRRDGSVQGPLKASQIIEWCRLSQVRSSSRNQMNAAIFDNISTTSRAPSTDPGGTQRSLNDSQQMDESLMRINELEASINSRQEQLEKEIDAIKLSYETREKVLQEELEKSRHELEKRKRPNSAVCIIL